jgi:hypothetical protein
VPAIGNIDEIAEVIGYSGIETLVEVCGGTRLFVGKRPSPALIQWLGEERALQLSERFGGFDIFVPNRKAVNHLKRTKPLILQGLLTTNEIALIVGCAEGTVRKHRGMLRREGAKVRTGRPGRRPKGATVDATGLNSAPPQ